MNHARSILVTAALACAGPFAPSADAALLGPANLRVEYLSESLGVDMPRPRFFWNDVGNGQDARPTAYQIQLRQGERNV